MPIRADPCKATLPISVLYVPFHFSAARQKLFEPCMIQQQILAAPPTGLSHNAQTPLTAIKLLLCKLYI